MDANEQPLPAVPANDTPASLGFLDVSAPKEEDEDLEPPPPSAYPLCTNEGRRGFLEAYIWRGEEVMFEAVSHIWNELCPPKALRCTLMGHAAGTGGTGKKALINFLRKALRESLDDGLIQPSSGYDSLDAFHAASMDYFAASYAHYEKTVAKYANLLNGDPPGAVNPAE